MTKTYGRRRVLDDVDLVFEPASFHLLVGANGSGKTTLLRLLATLTRPTSGRIEWAAPDGGVYKESLDVRTHLGYAGHTPLVHDELTVAENLSDHLRLHRIRSPQRVEETLHAWGLQGRRDERADTLSRGLRQRVALALAFSHHPQFLLLDEPANALDAGGLDTLLARLRERRTDATIVLATHDPDPFRPIADRTLELRDAAVQPPGGTA